MKKPIDLPLIVAALPDSLGKPTVPAVAIQFLDMACWMARFS
jgi:hypothetical protein